MAPRLDPSNVSRIREKLSQPSSQVAMAAAGNQMTPVALLPLVALYFDMNDIADYQVALSAAIILQSLMSLGIEYQVPSLSNTASVRILLKRAGLSSIVLTCVALALTIQGSVTHSPWVSKVVGAWGITASFALFAVCNSLRARAQDHRALVVSNLSAAAVTIAGQVAFGFIGWGLAGLVLPLAFGRIVGALTSLDFRRRRPRRDPQLAQNSSPMQSSRENFAWVSAFLISTMALQLPIIAADVILSPSQTATFATALRIASAPASLMGAGLSQAFIFDSSRILLTRPHEFYAFLNRTQKKLIVLSSLGGLLLALMGPISIIGLFDAEWHDAAWMILILALPFTLQTANRVMTPVFTMIHSSGPLLSIQVARLFLTVVSIAVAFYVVDGALALVIGVGVVSLVFQVVFVLTLKAVVRRRAAS